MNTTTLYRPVGAEEYKLIEDSDFTAFPPRLPEQPIFYPVLDEGYAIQIARDWNIPRSGLGVVMRFKVDTDFLNKYEIHIVGSSQHREYWIPAEELEEFNKHIVGEIDWTYFERGKTK